MDRGWGGGPALRASLNDAALRYGGSGFLHKHPVHRAPPSLPSLQVSPHFQPQSSAWVCSPNPTFEDPSLCAMVDTLSGLGEQGWGQDHLRRSHSVLPASDWCCLLFPSENEAPFRLVSSPLGLQVPPHFLSSPFSFLSPWSCLAVRGSFLSFQLSRPPASVQKGLCEYCSISDVFSMPLWSEMDSTTS